ncbi:MAG: 30S ribosomal protein S20 [Deltaproteobacteria bacterium]|nr:30S ribosomal protein S20 [Deltaproteobacteria bacterium]
MANHASALKRHRQSEKGRLRNAAVKSGIRSTVKKVQDAIAAGKGEDAVKFLKGAVTILDKAVTGGVLHRNNASRKISRLTTKVNAIAK